MHASPPGGGEAPPYSSEALEALYTTGHRACRRAVRRYGDRMVGQGKLSSQAYADLVDDAVTDGFMVFSQWWAQGRTDARQPLPLLVRLAQQCLRTALRKVNYQPREVALEEAILATGEASASTPVLVDSVLSTMPPREATALRGRYLDGDSMRTLGVRLQTTEAGAKCVLYRARHHFYAAWMEEPTPMTRGGGHEA